LGGETRFRLGQKNALKGKRKGKKIFLMGGGLGMTFNMGRGIVHFGEKQPTYDRGKIGFSAGGGKSSGNLEREKSNPIKRGVRKSHQAPLPGRFRKTQLKGGERSHIPGGS